MVNYLSADECSRLHIVKVYPGGGSFLSVIEDLWGTLEAKRSIVEWCINRMHAQALMIGWRRQPVDVPGVDTRDQLESPLNSGQINPAYIKHLDEWVSLAEEYGIYIIFEEWFSPMRAKFNGEWTGFDDSTFHEHWANFYRTLGAHFAGKTAVAGFVSGEEVCANVPGTSDTEDYPTPITGSTEFNALWNSVMTKLSKAFHEGAPNLNFIASPTMDWDGGIWTLGSKAWYPNAWQPLADPNPHVLYRVMWNPRNSIKTSTLYPYDDTAWIRDHVGSSIRDGVINWRRETGLPITVECLVWWVPGEGFWIWDAEGLQWLRDILKALSNEGIGLNFGALGNPTPEPYGSHDEYGNEREWVSVYGEQVEQLIPTPMLLDLPTIGGIALGITDAALIIYGLAHWAGLV